MSSEPDKPFDLEDRTLLFAKQVIKLCRQLSRDTVNNNLVAQLIRSSGSVGANYREAREAVSKKDLAHRLRISRKECKETSYWLELLMEANMDFKKEITLLLTESKELRNILSAMLDKFKV